MTKALPSKLREARKADDVVCVNGLAVKALVLCFRIVH